jgi:hypothetical protein
MIARRKTVATMNHVHPKAVTDHDPYEGLTEPQETFLRALAGWVHTQYPDGPPITLEISNGAAQDRLGLDIEADEVMVLMKNEMRGGQRPRAAGILIMNRHDAHDVVTGAYGTGTGASSSSYGDGSSHHNAPAVVDPCCKWAYVDGELICIGYGD